ncbi:MAG: hypothetical protein JWM56_485 [Candidatus Peribacteria bacterium]|nr:hypothetical protein [Candidatus Peribacteria bacterium]
MITLSRLQRSLVFIAIGCVLLILSGFLVAEHAHSIRETDFQSLPLAASLVTLERRETLLSQQVDRAELHAAVQTGSADERIALYVLPHADNHDRLLTLLDRVSTVLEKQGDQAGSASVEFEQFKPDTLHKDVSSRNVHMLVRVTAAGLTEWLQLFHVMGYLTVNDALATADRRSLLACLEEEGPSAADAVNDVLGTDLHVFAQDAVSYTDRLVGSFSSERCALVARTVLTSPLLIQVKNLFTGTLTQALSAGDVWPFPLATVTSLSAKHVTDDGYDLSVVFQLYARNAK